MLVDYHIHTKRCGHASGEMLEYVEAARKKGLTEIGFADHVPMYFLPKELRDSGVAMQEEELPLYINDVNELKKRFSDLNIKLGLEADYIPGQEKQLKKLLSAYNFDYVYGSIHFVDGWGFDDSRFIEVYQQWDLAQLYERYFTLLGEAAKSGLFDILSHPDLIKKFAFRLLTAPLQLYEKAARIIGEAGICIEINSAGLRYPAQELYPAEELLARCKYYGVPVTLGSDAHKPEQIGQDFDRSLELLKRVGYKEIATFSNRKRQMVSIS